MPGTAKTSSFLLSTATVMLGPKADLLTLNPAEHSIGLVKNFQFQADPGYVELTQGINNSVVMSVRNQDGLKASMEVYEYTLRNLAYAAGLDASGVSFDPMPALWSLKTSVAGGGSSFTIGTDISSNLAADDYVFLQKDQDDIVHIAKVDDVTFETPDTTVDIATGWETPTGVTFPAGARVGKVKRVDLGSGILFQPELSAKIVGVLPKNNEPFTILLPRVKVTKGMAVAFQTDNYGNLPFELTPYNQTTEDSFYDEFGPASAILFAR